jgi:hypothetical protein
LIVRRYRVVLIVDAINMENDEARTLALEIATTAEEQLWDVEDASVESAEFVEELPA